MLVLVSLFRPTIRLAALDPGAAPGVEATDGTSDLVGGGRRHVVWRRTRRRPAGAGRCRTIVPCLVGRVRYWRRPVLVAARHRFRWWRAPVRRRHVQRPGPGPAARRSVYPVVRIAWDRPGAIFRADRGGG